MSKGEALVKSILIELAYREDLCALAILSPYGLRTRLALMAFVRTGLQKNIVFNYCFDLYKG